MALNFESYKDITLKNAPLREVICQIRFAPLLEIAQELPAEFQKKIRSHFPKFNTRTSIVKSAQSLPNDYVFKTPNELSSVILSFTFIALSTKEYFHWKDFKKKIDFILSTFTPSYGDIFSSRIGLRYINELTPENTKIKVLDDFLDILNDELRCLIKNKSWNTPNKAVHQLSIPDNDYELTINVMFEQFPSARLILDYDYSVEHDPPCEIKRTKIISILENFHKEIYSAFRWSLNVDAIKLFEELKNDKNN